MKRTKSNYAEAVALITNDVMEDIPEMIDGNHLYY